MPPMRKRSARLSGARQCGASGDPAEAAMLSPKVRAAGMIRARAPAGQGLGDPSKAGGLMGDDRQFYRPARGRSFRSGAMLATVRRRAGSVPIDATPRALAEKSFIPVNRHDE